MTPKIRSEQPSDYHRIAEINALAFYPYLERPLTSGYLPEFPLVDALRHSANYDPELALAAELEGRVVGHAFFYPLTVLVGGQELSAVSLGPIAVDPAVQQQGIGSQLIREGHRRASEKNYAFSFLLGHDSYYPRFGYWTHMFGECRLQVNRDQIPPMKAELEERMVQPKDTETLMAMWRYWFHDVDLAIVPGASVLDWLTHAESIMSSVIVQDGEILGYLRYVKSSPAEVKLFIAKDKKAALAMLGFISNKCQEPGSIHLPLHPNAKAVKECLTLPYQVTHKTWSAAMIKILDANNPTINAYCQEVQNGERPAGLVIYPPCIEFA